VGIGSVIAAILFIAVITCMIFTAAVAKGINALIRYLSNSAGANGERDIQPPQLQPQNEGTLQIIYYIYCLVWTILEEFNFTVFIDTIK
jgi:uncharacterized membrane protein HdeD (DUF308 family)